MGQPSLMHKSCFPRSQYDDENQVFKASHINADKLRNTCMMISVKVHLASFEILSDENLIRGTWGKIIRLNNIYNVQISRFNSDAKTDNNNIIIISVINEQFMSSNKETQRGHIYIFSGSHSFEIKDSVQTLTKF